MDRAGPTRYDNIHNSSVIISFPQGDDSLAHAGFIVELERNHAYVIADVADIDLGLIGTDALKVEYLSGDAGAPFVYTSAQQLHTHGGLVGLRCSYPENLDTGLIKMVKMCARPLRMSQAVFLYEARLQTITPGLVTRIYGSHFSHCCGLTANAEYGAPVINKDGELVGICRSSEYHLNAISILALVDTIESILDTLRNSATQ